MKEEIRILFDVGHPSDVLLFKNTIRILKKDGYSVKTAARDKQNTLKLLEVHELEYEVYGKNVPGLLNKAYRLVLNDYNLLKVAKKFNPDLLISFGSAYAAHVSRIIKKPHITLEDTDHTPWFVAMLYIPFSDIIITPACLKMKYVKIPPKKEVKINGYKELAYLHPNYFTPDPSVLDKIGIKKNDRFILMRLSSWDASHDRRDRGFGFKNEQELLEFISKLENYGTIFINSEVRLSPKLQKYLLPHLDDLHSLLYYATLYIGEGATTASEAGVLGTPWIFVSTTSRGYLDDQQNNHGLGYVISDPKLAMKKVFELLEQDDLKEKWQEKKKKLLSDKIDVTKFMVEFIENYALNITK